MPSTRKSPSATGAARATRGPRPSHADPGERLERIQRFAGATFVTSAVDVAGFPASSGPEFAFVGRSNAGKSSTINKLVGQTRLAYASKMPGRTRELNFFALRGGGHLVDLPGYGFARTPKDKQRVWSGLIDQYLAERESLACVVLVSDIRHAPNEMDLAFLQWFATARGANRAIPTIWLLNKADKLTQSERMRIERQSRKELSPLSSNEFVLPVMFSAHSGLGIKQVDAEVNRAFNKLAENEDNDSLDKKKSPEPQGD